MRSAVVPGALGVFGVFALLTLPLSAALCAAGTGIVNTIPRGHHGYHGQLSPPRLPASATAPVGGIPANYFRDFLRSGARFSVPWAVLAGIYRLECDFGRSRLPGCYPPGSQNAFGAQGPGQFLPGTWRRGLRPHQVIPLGPPTSSISQGYATDGDGDGVANPWDPADAIASTARMLAANGATSGHLAAAIFAYNHDPAYVSEVITLARRYDREAAHP